MNRWADFTQLDGRDINQDLLDFMQSCYRDGFGAITSGLGDLLIITGVVDNGSNTTGGWVTIGGELMPLIGSASATYVYVDTMTDTDLYGDGTTRIVNFTKVARLTSVQSSGNYLFTDFRPWKTDALNVNDSNVFASAKAVKLLKDEKDTDVTALQALIDAFGFLAKGSYYVGNVPDGNGITVTVTHNQNITVPYVVQVTLQSLNGTPANDCNLFFVTHLFQPNSFKITIKESGAATQNVQANWMAYKS